MEKISNITGVILAGGLSKRFGTNKAFAHFLGTPIIERVLQVMRTLFDDLLIVTNTPEDYTCFGIPTVSDLEPHKGPLGGIVTAFDNTLNDRIFVAACDMPVLNAPTIERIIAQGGSADAAVATHGGIHEYLLALYSRRLLHRLRCCLGEDQLSLRDFCSRLSNVSWIPVEGDAWFNVNTKKDLESLEKNHAE